MNRHTYLDALKKEHGSLAKLAKNIGLSENYLLQIKSGRRPFSDRVLRRLVNIDANERRSAEMGDQLFAKKDTDALPEDEQIYGIMFINEALKRSGLSTKAFAHDCLNSGRDYLIALLNATKPVSSRMVSLVERNCAMKFSVYKNGLLNQGFLLEIERFQKNHLVLNALNVYFKVKNKEEV